MSHKQLTQRGLVGMALVIFLGGSFTTSTHYWLQQYDYVAKVNGVPIRTAVYEQNLAQARQMFAGAPEEIFQKITVEQLIDRQLFLQAAQAQAIEVQPTEIEQEWQTLMQTSYNNERERMLRALGGNRHTEQSFREELKQRLLSRKLQAQLTDKVQISEAELRQHYHDNQKDYHKPERIQVQHILLHLDADHPQSESETRQRAEALLTQLRQGQAFEELAKQHSDDASSKDQGGQLPAFAKGEMVPEFEQAAWALQPGEISSAPVKSEYGWHLIRRGPTLPAGPQAFEEVRSIFEPRLLEEKKQLALQDWLSKQRQEAQIETHPKYQAQPAAISAENQRELVAPNQDPPDQP